jgi:hypothetical protein
MASWKELNSKAEMLAQLPSDFFLKKSDSARRAVHASFSKLARLLNSPVQS